MSNFRQHAELIENALAADKAAKSPLVASWQRSKLLYKLNPDKYRPPERLSQYELEQRKEKIGSLLHIANPRLDRLYMAFGSSGCCVLLADEDGVPVARRGSDPDDKIFNRLGLWTGALWNEQSEGTNGIGTCLIEKRALTIHKEQHFHTKNVGFSCSAAPIFDHKGRIIAVLDISSCRSDLTKGFSRLIEDNVINVARQIEAENFCQYFSGNKIILADNMHAETGVIYQGVSLIALDNDDMIIGATRAARRFYNLGEGEFSPLPLSSLKGFNVNIGADYMSAGKRSIKQALARFNGNKSKVAKALGISRATLYRKIKRLGIK